MKFVHVGWNLDVKGHQVITELLLELLAVECKYGCDDVEYKCTKMYKCTKVQKAEIYILEWVL